MAFGRFRIPSEFKDEDKWLKFFTKPQLVALGIALLVSATVLVVLTKYGLFAVGFAIFLLIMLTAFTVVMKKVPESYYLMGANETIGIILLRVIIKKLKRKVIYVANTCLTRRDKK